MASINLVTASVKIFADMAGSSTLAGFFIVALPTGQLVRYGPLCYFYITHEVYRRNIVTQKKSTNIMV